MMAELELVDIWKVLHKTQQDFSFYSRPHKSFSRIDFILLHKTQEYLVDSCEYLPRTLSDHSPLVLTVNAPTTRTHPRRWRFSNYLLNDLNFIAFLNDNIESFLNFNVGSASPGVVWESLKAYLRGIIISYSSGKKKKHQCQLNLLSKDIKKLEHDCSVYGDENMFQKLNSLRLEYDMLSTKEAECALLRSKQRYYEQGDKIGKLLAWQIRKEDAVRSINAIRRVDNTVIRDPILINQEFMQFYKLLYTSQGTDTVTIHTFLNNLDIPSLTEVSRDCLEGEITEVEIQEAISCLAAGKSPGMDGFSIDFFKAFIPKLIRPLKDMYMQAIESQRLPDSLEQAMITLLLKPGKDPYLCGSYRPILLLNSDYKVFAKIIALRLEKVISQLVHMDQTGFIQNRCLFDNVRRLLNVIFSASQVAYPVIAVSLDAEKAFDRVEWLYLLSVLQKMNFGPKFINMVKMLYNHPTAVIQTNSEISTLFSLERGTRQGCPLSPLLFALAIEPLAIAIRSHDVIRGFTTLQSRHVISLYADDIMLYLINVNSSIPALTTLLQDYGIISGYKINVNKSVSMPLNIAATQLPLRNFPFTWNMDKFTYLGLQISRDLSQLYNLNYVPLLKRVEGDLDRWKSLPISLIGRVNSIKMTILPKFLYLFQALPPVLPKFFFKDLNRIISRFLWKGKVPRVKLNSLFMTFRNGGLKLPNFYLYYCAAQLRSIWIWRSECASPPAWRQLEEGQVQGITLAATPFIPLKSLKKLTSNPLIVGTCNICTDLRKKMKCKQTNPI